MRRIRSPRVGYGCHRWATRSGPVAIFIRVLRGQCHGMTWRRAGRYETVHARDGLFGERAGRLPIGKEARQPVQRVEYELRVLRSLRRVHAHRHVLRAFDLRRKHRGFTEHGDAPAAEPKDRALQQPVAVNLWCGIGELPRHGRQSYASAGWQTHELTRMVDRRGKPKRGPGERHDRIDALGPGAPVHDHMPDESIAPHEDDRIVARAWVR